MRRSFDTRVSISIENGLSVGLVQALATLVLVSTVVMSVDEWNHK
jgi:hypothetical protein